MLTHVQAHLDLRTLTHGGQYIRAVFSPPQVRLLLRFVAHQLIMVEVRSTHTAGGQSNALHRPDGCSPSQLSGSHHRVEEVACELSQMQEALSRFSHSMRESQEPPASEVNPHET